MFRKHTITNHLRVACGLAQVAASRWMPDAPQRRLRKLLRHAFDNVPHYRRLFEEAGVRPEQIRNISDLSRLPISTKEQLRRLPVEELTARGTRLDQCWRAATSGTSGTPFTVYRDDVCYCLFFALTARALRMAGARPKDRMLAIGLSYYPENLFVQRLGLGRVRRISPLQEPARLAAAIAAYRPDVLHCYASVLKGLLSLGRLPHVPRIIISSADYLDEKTRRDCATVFGVNPVQMYGAVETGRIGSECQCHDGLHVFNDFILAELMPRADGLRRVVLTDLTNFTMPFIRYDQGDLAEPVEAPCPCGRSFPRLRLLGARASDLVRLPTGGTISAWSLAVPLNYVPGVVRFQIVQESLTRIVARVVCQPGCDQQALERAVTKMAAELPGIRIELGIVGHLPPDPSGKFSQFRSNLTVTSI